ncbi:hypothetical protein [Anaerotruncus rubiinfantis]|uniref:hypothetical protein n=1 Tax=Anaerotruncus rubiinfantis TaxID=1720200 RepID=UPI001897EA96|nr:hypothetical protein [Anaerotruncus rubiinfantis]
MNRLCGQTVTLYNHVGEVDRKATYLATVLRRVYFESMRGKSRRTSGDAANDSMLLCIFDDTVIAESPAGQAKTYLPYRQWIPLTPGEKAAFWTLSPDDWIAEGSVDYAIPDGTISELEKQHPCCRIKSIDRFAQGNRRMWHWEVSGA